MTQPVQTSSVAIALWVQDQIVPSDSTAAVGTSAVGSSSSSESSGRGDVNRMPQANTTVFIDGEQNTVAGSDVTDDRQSARDDGGTPATAGVAAAPHLAAPATPASSTHSPLKSADVATAATTAGGRIYFHSLHQRKGLKSPGIGSNGSNSAARRHRTSSAAAADVTTTSIGSSVEEILSLCGGRIPYEVISSVDSSVVRPLLPTVSSLQLRHRAVQDVAQAISRCLRLSGFGYEIRFYVFGSVNLRTVLPDGDIDITLVVDDAAAPQQAIQDLLPKLRDILPQCNPRILVDQLVFAEVRVLKLVYYGFSIDVTVGQKGGLGTACFLHEVDDKIGFHHLFKKSLTLIKAWCNYEAHILGATGGYLGTYAVTVMLISLLNEVPFHLLRNDPNSCASPFRVLVKFLYYVSSFDFENYCMTIHGPVPVAFMAQSTIVSPYGGYVFPERKEVIDHRFVDDILLRYGLHNSMTAASTPPMGDTATTTPTGSAGYARGMPTNSTSPSPAGFPNTPLVSGLAPSSSPQVSPTNTPRLSPVPNGPNGGGFPLRNMNVSDPLRPASNLTRGVCRNHQGRIRNAMLHGLNVMSHLMSRIDLFETDSTIFLHEVFPSTEVALHAAATEQHLRSNLHPPSPGGSGLSELLQCSNCIQPSVFCADVGLQSQPVFVEPAATRPPGVAKPLQYISHHHHHQQLHHQHNQQHHHFDVTKPPSSDLQRPFVTHVTVEKQQRPISPLPSTLSSADRADSVQAKQRQLRAGMRRGGGGRGGGGGRDRGAPNIAAMDFPPLPANAGE